MSKRWQNLKDQFKGSNRDLDAEFEQFLNESLSDESFSSPRIKSPVLKASRAAASQLPWWTEEDEGDAKLTEDIRQSWMKPQQTETRNEEGDANKVKSPDAVRPIGQPAVPAVGSSQAMLSVDSRPETGMSMSKDSLDEASQKPHGTRKESLKSIPTEDYEDSFTFTGETTPSSPDHLKSPPETAEARLDVGDRMEPAPGMDTLNEMADKRRFFEAQRDVDSSSVDYREKLNQMSDSESFSPLRTKDDKLQATGAELGNSIFNATGESGFPAQKPVESAKEGEDEEQYSDEFEESEEEGVQVEKDDRSTNDNVERPSGLAPGGPAKPSLLSKVSLMDSLDSTLDRKRPQTRPRTRSMEAKKEETDKSPELSATKSTAGGGTTTPKDTAGGGTTTTTGEIAELQEALRAAQMTGTDTISKPGTKGKIDLPPTPTIIQGPGEKYTEEPEGGSVNPRQMILEKTPSGETRSRGFDLQPIIAQDESVTDDSFHPVAKPRRASRDRGFDLKPAALPDQDTGLQDSWGFTQQTSMTRDSVVNPVESQEFSPLPLESTNIETGNARSRGFDLQPVDAEESPVKPQGRGFDLQPTENFGFSLQPVANLLRAGDEQYRSSGTEDEDTPPPDSLRSIKSIARARKSAGVERVKTSVDKKAPAKKSKIPKEMSARKGMGSIKGGGAQTAKTKGKLAAGTPDKKQNRSAAGTPDKKKNRSAVGTPDKGRFSWKHPSPSSPPSWSPTPTLRSSKHKGKLVSSVNRSRRKEQKSTDVRDGDNSRQQLAASVESFANYLRHFVRPQENGTEPPPMKWSDDEPSISASRTSLRKASEEHRLSREKALLKEVEKWQLSWQDERKRNEKLIVDMAAREKDWAKKGESTRMQYEAVIHDLKQELFVVQSRLREEEEGADPKKRVIKGENLKGASKEELQKLEKDVREQEGLLRGYQQENERLYQEIKQIQAKAKADEARMFSENQKLASELAALREKKDKRESGGYVSNLISPGSAVLGAERITQLQSQVNSLKRRETELVRELDELSGGKMDWHSRLREVERERDAALQRADVALDTNTRDLQEQKERHEAEVERLNRKLKWYAENQAMLDRDVMALRRKDEEIKELKEVASRLQAQHGANLAEKNKRTVERTSDAKRIRDLERQVKEMEEIIKRRYPNSLPALIYAAASAPCHAQTVVDNSPKNQSPSYLFLENRVKKLEKELEERDDEDSKRIRAVEQKYNSMRFEYEERIKGLERELKAANDKTVSLAKPHAHVQDLEQELKSARQNHEEKVREMQTEIDVMKEAMTKVTMAQQKLAPNSRKQRGEDERLKVVEDSYRRQIESLREELEGKDVEMVKLRQTCTRLQQQRHEMLADKHLQEDNPIVEIKRISDQHEREIPKPDPRVNSLERENLDLKHRLSALSLDIDQQRVRSQASLAETERATRQAREDAAEQIEKLRAQQRRELDQVKAEYALSHSTSKVAELKSRLAGQDIVMQKLKDKLASNAVAADTLAASKVREEVLQQQIRQLQQDLRRAKEKFSPEMKHFDNLEAKIFGIEQRHEQREHELQRMIERTQFSAELEKREIEEKWRNTLRQKNEEIEHFRTELDSILEVLSELKRQGVVIPVRRNPETFIP